MNKVETMVTAKWQVMASNYFSYEEKILISEKLKDRINSVGFLQISVQETRSQLENKYCMSKIFGRFI